MTNQGGIRWTDLTLEKSLKEVMKVAERAEKSALRAGGQLIKKNVKEQVRTSIPGSTKNNSGGIYFDRLIDAVRITKPQNGFLKYHILGTKKKDSGTFRLRFFESARERYQTKIKGKKLKTKRYLGNLGKFNGFFARGVAASQGQLKPTMEAALEKYIKRAWNG